MKEIFVLVYTLGPNDQYGIGGVRRYLKRVSQYFDSENVNWKFEMLHDKPVKNEHLSPFANLVKSFLVAMKLTHLDRKASRPLIYAQDTAYSGLAGIIAGKLCRIPCVVHCHNLPSLLYMAREGNSSLKSRIYLLFLMKIEQIVLKNCDRIIVTNQGLSRAIMKKGVDSKHIQTIPMGVDIKKIQSEISNANYEIDSISSKFRIGYIGRLSKIKNLFTLLDSFSDFIHNDGERFAELIIVGGGPDKELLEEYAEKIGITNCVTFTGYRIDISNFLKMFDIFIQPSLTEGSSLALLEAMAAGLPIIASNISANKSILIDNYNALLFNPLDSDSLTILIKELFVDKELRKRISSNALSTIRKYDYSKILRLILDTLNDTLEKNKRLRIYD